MTMSLRVGVMIRVRRACSGFGLLSPNLSQTSRHFTTRPRPHIKDYLRLFLQGYSTVPRPALYLLVVPPACLGLGFWQIQVMKAEKKMYNDLQGRTMSPPTDLPLDLRELEKMELLPVRVFGHFDHDREIVIAPRQYVSPPKGDPYPLGKETSRKEGGYVITPFVLRDRPLTILVNRGWVPKYKIPPEARLASQIEGDHELIGVVLLSVPPPSAMFRNKPEENIWSYRDVEAMAQHWGTAPVYLAAHGDSTIQGGPIGHQVELKLRGGHTPILILYFGLAGGTMWIWFKRFILKIV